MNVLNVYGSCRFFCSNYWVRVIALHKKSYWNSANYHIPSPESTIVFMSRSCKSPSPGLALYYIHGGTITSSSSFSSCSSNKDSTCCSANCIRINFWPALGSPPRVTCYGLAMTRVGALRHTQCCSGGTFCVGHRTAMTFGPGLCFCS
jgi:hypothetical protein